MVLPGYALIAQGIQVHAAAWPGGTFTRQEVLCCAFAMQASAYVVMAGGVLREADIPEELREIVRPMNGHSGIVGPSGKLIAGPLREEEGIVTARGNLGEVLLQKMQSDHAGHYSRPDVFEFHVNTRPRTVATFEERGTGEQDEWRKLSAGIADGAIRSESQLRGAAHDLLGEEAGI